jgi:hypothetical protein
MIKRLTVENSETNLKLIKAIKKYSLIISIKHPFSNKVTLFYKED